MFKKLKRKFVIVNMSLLTFVFVSIFSCIYIITKINGERQISFTLDAIMHAPPKPPSPREPAMVSSIIVDVDKEGNILRSFSFIDMEDDLLKEMVSKALASHSTSGKMKAGDFYYAFRSVDLMEGRRIFYVNRTPQQHELMNLLITLASVGGVSLILLLFISLYFANRTVKPIMETFEKQKQFIADASHELKTPLTIIKTNLAVVTSNEEEPVSSQAKWLTSIALQTNRMANLVSDMLSLAKVDSSEQVQFFSLFHFSKVLEGTLLSFEAVMFENGITLQTDIAKDVYIHGEQGGVEKLISILVDNAIKNTPPQGVISVSLSCEKSTISLKVSNTGAGIPPEHLEKIFERFYRADASRARESGGYGLGLAIAKSIVLQHQGRIYAQSTVGENTTFVVELPEKRK